MSLKNIMLNQRNQNRIVSFHLYLVHEQAKLTYELTRGEGCREVEVGGLTKKKYKGTFRGNGNVLDLGNSIQSVCICQNSLNCILNIFVFYCV